MPNGEAESFMKLSNKTERIAYTQGRDSLTVKQEMLRDHPATGISPYEALMGRKVKTKLNPYAAVG